jgi:hypothetical protein
MIRTLLSILVLTLAAGCMGGGQPAQPTTFVTPCHIIGTGIVFRVNGTPLSTKIVSEPLSHMFVDDITSDRAAAVRNLYGISCYWGSNVGEVKEYYYCNGSYVAPEINEQGMIARNLRKDFKIGFSVEEYKGETWTDMSGRVHNEDTYYDLTVSSVEPQCTVYYNNIYYGGQR